MMIAANWKAYVESTQKAKALFAAAKRVAGKKGIEIVLAPPAPYLGLLASGNRSKVSFAAQDISDSMGGAATGEVTAAAVASAGARYVIVGHSERRAKGESDTLVLAKVQHALAHGLRPILCIGEQQRDAEAHYLQFIRAQISAVFSALTTQERTQVIIAYEPIWAIGKTAADAITPEDLAEMVLYIRKVVSEYMPSETVTILYGGSVEPGNEKQLATGSSINGFLVGHASTSVQDFLMLAKAVS